MSNDQIEFWTGEGGRRWLAAEALAERTVGPFGAAAMAEAAPQPGETVLDVGCGSGATTVELAQAVGPGGSVVGLDVSPPLLEAARARAAAAELATVSFIEADAQAQDVASARFDLVFSRFGVMFFDDPIAAFRRLRAAATPGGRLAFVCWRSIKENPWSFIPFMAAVPHLPPIPRPGPDDPGPYAFGDPDRVRRILGGSGWREATLEPVEHVVALGGGLDEAVRFTQALGPAARVLASLAEPDRQRPVEAIRAALAAHLTPEGRVELGGACWVVTARA